MKYEHNVETAVNKLNKASDIYKMESIFFLLKIFNFSWEQSYHDFTRTTSLG
jgi:hypothetical protein